jgi:hypothetical protein
MSATAQTVTVHDMVNAAGISTFVLQEFRLHAADTAGEAARLVAGFSGGIEPPVPLLTSIDDHRDVAIVRGLHAGEEPRGDPRQRESLDPMVASWQPLQQYTPRITARSQSPPSYYRLAVTGSGINNGEPGPLAAMSRGVAEDGTATRFGLLWTGVPLGSYAGLLVLLGSYDGRHARLDPRDWPLPLSDELGVRIYESRR